MLSVSIQTRLRRGEIIGLRWESSTTNDEKCSSRPQIVMVDGRMIEKPVKEKPTKKPIPLTVEAYEAIISMPEDLNTFLVTASGTPASLDNFSRVSRN